MVKGEEQDRRKLQGKRDHKTGTGTKSKKYASMAYWWSVIGDKSDNTV